MKFLSLFSGIEAASAAWGPLGWQCVAVAEIDKFACAVLAARYPHIPNLGDIRHITREQIEALGHIDLVMAGFPCQDLSIAGRQKGLTNADGTLTRSGLFFTGMQLVEWAKPRWTVIENVPGLFSTHQGRDFASVVGELAGVQIDLFPNGWRNSGVALGPRGLVEWVTLDAQYVRVQSHPRAVPQRRRRIFFVRDSGDWQSREPLFLKPESMCGHPPPRRETGKRAARTISARTKGGGGLGTDAELDGALAAFGGNNTGGPIDVATACQAHGGPHGRMDFASETFVAHALRADGFDASEDGIGRGTPIVPIAFSAKDHGADASEGAGGNAL